MTVFEPTEDQNPGAADEVADGWEALVRTVASLGPEEQSKLPDFFIVGHPKCGTTALYEMLRRHPRIHMPAKEPRFFVMKQVGIDRDPEGARQWEPPPLGAQRPPAWRPRSLAGYLELFAGAAPGQLVGEATPAYLRSHVAAGRIAAVRPDARIIAILREPTSFMRSFHLQAIRGYNETEKDFRKALALEAERREGRSIPRLSRTPADLLYSDLVHYVEQLRRYHAVFPANQVLVLIYEEFRRDNETAVRSVLRFLGVDDGSPIEVIETRSSRDLRFRNLHLLVNLRRTALRNSGLARSLSKALTSITPPRLRGAVRSRWGRIAYGEPLPLDETFMHELRRRLKPAVEELSDYLGRDLVGLWGYDKLD